MQSLVFLGLSARWRFAPQRAPETVSIQSTIFSMPFLNFERFNGHQNLEFPGILDDLGACGVWHNQGRQDS